MRKHPFILILLVSFLLPLALEAQVYRPFRLELQEVIDNTRFRFGPFRLYPLIKFQEIGYDSNVFRDPTDAEPSTDFTFTFSPELRVHTLVGNSLILTFTYNPEYVFYNDQTALRRLYHSYWTDIKWQLMNSFVFSGSFINQSRLHRPWGEIIQKLNEKRLGYQASFYYEGPRDTTLGIYGERQVIEYKDAEDPSRPSGVAGRLNRTENSISAEFYHRIFPEIRLFVRSTYSEYDFEFEQANFKDSNSWQISSGLAFPLIGDLTGRFSLGYKYLYPKRFGPKGFSGLIGDTALEYRYRRFNFRFIYRRDTPFSVYTDNIFYIQDWIGPGVSFYPTRITRLDYNFSYGEGRYPEPTTIRLPDGSYSDVLRKDRYWQHSVGLVFRIWANTGVGLTYNYWERESNVDRRRRNYFVGGYLTYDF